MRQRESRQRERQSERRMKQFQRRSTCTLNCERVPVGHRGEEDDFVLCLGSPFGSLGPASGSLYVCGWMVGDFLVVLRGGLRCFFRRPMRPARGRKVMDSDAAPECDVSLSTDFKSHDVESAEGRRRELRRAQIAVLLLSRFLLQLSRSRSSPSCCIRNLPDEQ